MCADVTTTKVFICDFRCSDHLISDIFPKPPTVVSHSISENFEPIYVHETTVEFSLLFLENNKSQHADVYIQLKINNVFLIGTSFVIFISRNPWHRNIYYRRNFFSISYFHVDEITIVCYIQWPMSNVFMATQHCHCN